MADVNISVDLNSSGASRGLKELKTGLSGLGFSAINSSYVIRSFFILPPN